MKTWKSAEVVELNINMTNEGGKDSTKIDKYWTDRTTEDLYASFASGGNDSGDPIDVIK